MKTLMCWDLYKDSIMVLMDNSGLLIMILSWKL